MNSPIFPGCHDLDKSKLPVVDYTFEFQTLSAACGWKVPSLLDTFHHGSSIAIKDQLFSVEHPADLESFITLNSQIDNHLRECIYKYLKTGILLFPVAASPSGGQAELM